MRFLHLLALPLLHLIDFQPCVLEIEGVFGIGELECDLLLFLLEWVSYVLYPGVVGLLQGYSLQICILVGVDQALKVLLLAPLDDSRGGESKTPEKLIATWRGCWRR